MGRSKRSKQRTTAAKKSDDSGSSAKRSGKAASLLVVGLLGVGAFASWVIPKWTARPVETKAVLQAPSPAATAPPTVPMRSQANATMGSDPRKDQVSDGTTVSFAGTPGKQDYAADVPPGELIKLDPICGTIASQTPRLAPGNPAPSTLRMAQRLKDLDQKANPAGVTYLSDRLVEMIEGKMTNASSISEKFRLQYSLAIQQINAGRPDSALNTFSAIERLMAANGGKLSRESQADMRIRKAIAFFRLGEQENCLATHNAESCLFPLKPKAYHLLPRGSRGAISLFKAHLAENPDDYTGRWMLNLAHMTLGEYPDKVDPQYLIPPKTFDSEYNMPRFPDVSDGLGIDANDLAGGVIVDDFDNDGFNDLIISALGVKGQLRYFHNSGNGTFAERTSEAGLVGETGALNIQQTDYNNDGLLDIWMLRGGWLEKEGRMPNSLVRNNGDGTFTDVTEEAGLLSFHPTQASRWFDYDGDGWLDLFIGNESVDPKDPDWCELYHNNRDGTFTECARVSGIRVAEYVKGVACGDYDNDGRPDLYLSVRGQIPKILLHNDGPDASGQWKFSDRAAMAGVDNRILSFGTFFFDYNNDGWEDLLILGYYFPGGIGEVAKDYLGLPNDAEKPKFYRNNRDGTFTDATVEVRLNRVCHTMGHNYGDLDNDGWLDFYCGTGDPDLTTLIPNRMFRNSGGKLFQDVTTATGTGHIQKGHGVAFADFDDDGDQDVYTSMGGAYGGDLARNALFMNPGTSNRWVKLKLVGTKANRAAIGARIKVTVQTTGGTREVHRVVSSGGNFGSNPLRQEIGLGDATAITAVDIRWPGSNTRQSVTRLELDRAYQIREGDAAPVAMKLHPVQLERSDRAPHTAKLQSKN